MSKLIDSHISSNIFQKQKVRLATQALSNSKKYQWKIYYLHKYNPNRGGLVFKSLIKCPLNHQLLFIEVIKAVHKAIVLN